MDRALIEEIARQVIDEITDGRTGDASSDAVGPGGGWVVVVGGSAAGLDEVARAVREASAGDGAVLIAASDAGAVAETFRTRLGSSVRNGCPEDAARARAVVVPLLSLPLAARIGLGLADEPGAAAVYRALAAGVPVVAARDGAASVGGGAAAPPFRGLAEEHLRRMEALGVRVVPATGLAAALAEAAGRSGGATAPPMTERAVGGTVPARSATIPVGNGPTAPTPDVFEAARAYAIEKLADDPACTPCLAKLSAAFEECIRSGVCRIGIDAEDGKHPFDPADPGAAQIARLIDHTLLKPDAKPQDIEKLCAEAKEYGFASVCINPQYVALAKRLLRGTPVKVCTVIGFPLGATTTSTKAAETRDAIADGADEIDMVINIGALKAGEYDKVREDIEAVVRAARGRIVKVILETHLLTDEEKVAACEIAKAAGAHFVKTSTGFTGGGATVEDVSLMRRVVGPLLGVKASGGVRDRKGAEAMIRAGATRIGASAGVAIVKGEKGKGKGY